MAKKTSKCGRCGRRHKVRRLVEVVTPRGPRLLCFDCQQPALTTYRPGPRRDDWVDLPDFDREWQRLSKPQNPQTGGD